MGRVGPHGALSLSVAFAVETGRGTDPARAAAPAKAPPVRTLSGTGAMVQSLRLAANSPLVVTGNHQGESNFIVSLVGQRQESGC